MEFILSQDNFHGNPNNVEGPTYSRLHGSQDRATKNGQAGKCLSGNTWRHSQAFDKQL